MAYGFIRTACLSPRLKVADCVFNAEEIVKGAEAAAANGAAVIVFPELSITAYTCGDLFFQQALLSSAEEELTSIIQKTS